MTDDFTAKQLAKEERGRRAAELLADPLFAEAFAVCHAAYINALETSGFKQRDERDELWRRLQTLKKIREHLETVASTGRLAAEQLREIRRAGSGRWVLF